MLEGKYLDMFTLTKDSEVPSCILSSIHTSHSAVLYRSHIGLGGLIYMSQNEGKFIQFCMINLLAQHILNFKAFIF